MAQVRLFHVFLWVLLGLLVWAAFGFILYVAHEVLTGVF